MAPRSRRLIVGAWRTAWLTGTLWLGLTACNGGAGGSADGSDFVDPYLEQDSGGRRNDVTRVQNSADLARDLLRTPTHRLAMARRTHLGRRHPARFD